MLLGYFLNMAFADRYVILDDKMNKIDEYSNKEQIPECYKSAYIMFVTTDKYGSIIFQIKSENF